MRGPLRAGLAFGGNLGDPTAQIAQAARLIEAREIARILAASSLWRTPPWGLADQPPFINSCALVETALPPRALLHALKRIERDMGREAGVRWGPRRIDIDVIFYDDLVLDEPDLVLPHPRLFERAFVLAPLAEIAPDLAVAGRPIGDALARLDRTGLEIVGGRDWAQRRERRAMGEWIELKCADGATISAWRARPQGPPRGGMVVLQEIFGVNHHIRAVAERYAAEGYFAIAPALFDRVEKGVELGYDGSDMGRARDLRARTSLDDTLADVQAAIAAAAEGGPVGLVGYCWGGSLAWLAACRLQGLSASVGYYGGFVVNHVDEAPGVPVMLHFGAHDKHIPLSDVERIRAAHPETPVYVYDADHGFNCDERSSFDEASAQIARERTLAFFERTLGGSG